MNRERLSSKSGAEPTAKLPTLRMCADQQELADRIAQTLPRDGTMEPRPGIHFRRHSSPTGRVYASAQPSFCLIAQGTKLIFLGEHLFQYDSAHYLVTTLELPLSGEVVEASAEQPYLSFRMILDPTIATSVMVDAGIGHPSSENTVKAVNVSPLEAHLLDATLRLVRLIHVAEDYRVLAPLIVREIHYRLLTGAQMDRMRHLARVGGHDHRMARAIQMLREQFQQPVRIDDVARELDMSVSSFHAHFKAVTTMSPLQFLKHLRLQEARRLMLNEHLEAAEAGFRVGYEDASHFNREYKRLFGHPPKRDIASIRQTVR